MRNTCKVIGAKAGSGRRHRMVALLVVAVTASLSLAAAPASARPSGPVPGNFLLCVTPEDDAPSPCAPPITHRAVGQAASIWASPSGAPSNAYVTIWDETGQQVCASFNGSTCYTTVVSSGPVTHTYTAYVTASSGGEVTYYVTSNALTIAWS